MLFCFTFNIYIEKSQPLISDDEIRLPSVVRSISQIRYVIVKGKIIVEVHGYNINGTLNKPQKEIKATKNVRGCTEVLKRYLARYVNRIVTCTAGRL